MVNFAGILITPVLGREWTQMNANRGLMHVVAGKIGGLAGAFF